MKKINKSSEPKLYKDFIRNKKPVNWDGINKIRIDLRKHILENEQQFQCAYCESRISYENTSSHIDHFKLKHIFPELTFIYSNLLVSCNHPNHCASTKDTEVNSKEDFEKIINPVNEDPTGNFEYYTSGKLIAKNEKAKFTRDIFNLNHPGLKQQRNNIAWAVQGYKSSLTMDEVINEIGEFESFIRYIWD